MDTLRGKFGSPDDSDFDTDDGVEYDSGEDEAVHHEPPPEIGQDERRMQVRAYNHWASLLADRNFPSIEDLEPENLPDFGPFSVLLDFTGGTDNPAVPYLGKKLALECGTESEIDELSEVPSRSLLSRITDHYMQILANQAPIGFEAEFVNQRGATILYRGILLPFSSDDDSIDFIYGVINWKEMADQITSDELLLEIDQALEADAQGELGDGAAPRASDPITDWADGPGAPDEGDDVADFQPFPDESDESADPFPAPTFGSLDGSMAKPTKTPLDLDAAKAAYIPTADDGEADGFDDWDINDAVAPLGAEDGLYDCLAAARECALAARSCEDRSRGALYEAVGRAFDVSLAAAQEPEEFEQLVTENQLTVQDRAPLTPVVKLVFGADYDKTRLTEYAAVLGHAHRMELERGSLAGFLREAEGGLKGVVKAERRLRREESGKAVEPVDAPREQLAKKLRKITPQEFGDISSEGAEFALVMIRRMPDGTVAMLGELGEDVPLVERAARKLIAES